MAAAAPKTDTSDVCRPIITSTTYQSGIEHFKAELKILSTKNLEEQLDFVIRLIEFMKVNFDSDNPNAMLLPKLLEGGMQGRNLRKRLLLPIIQQSGLFEEELAAVARAGLAGESWLDDKFIKLIEKAKPDILLDDAKQCMRMLFEVIRFFPRDFRGDLINPLKLGANGWYMLEFCGAVFMSDAVTEREAAYGGVQTPPYGYDGNEEKQKQMAYFQVSIMQQQLVVKGALMEIIKTDLPKLGAFFTTVIGCLQRKEPLNLLTPMEYPSLLMALLWYTKHFFNLQKLLAILPAVPGNADKVNLEISERIGLRSADSLGYEVGIGGTRISVAKLARAGIIGTSKPGYGITKVRGASAGSLKNFAVSSEGRPITASQRLLLASATNYLQMNTIKGRLGLIRKLQLIGEAFTPPNFGEDLKYIDYLDHRILASIRNGLTHIEENDNFAVIRMLELNPTFLAEIFRELQTLKEQIYEELALRQAEFPAWPNMQVFESKISASGYYAWRDVINKYLEAMKKVYLKDRSFIPNQALLDDTEIDEVIAALKPELREGYSKILRGKAPLPEGLNLDKNIKNLVVDIKNSYKSKNILNKAASKYRELNLEANRRTKEARQATIDKNMSVKYPHLEELGKLFWEAQNKPHHSIAETFKTLQDRFAMLEILFNESRVIPEAEAITLNYLQKNLQSLLEQDMAFALSAYYLFGQVLSLINKLASISNLATVQPGLVNAMKGLINFRNHLEHTDPILESVELPYYQMEAGTPRMTAIALGEVFFNFSQKIKAMDPAGLIEQASDVTTQAGALEPGSFVFASASGGASSSASAPARGGAGGAVDFSS